MFSEVALFTSSVLLSKLSQYKLDSMACTVQSCNSKPLYDILHANFPNMSKYEKAIDFIPIVIGAAVAVLAIMSNSNVDIKSLLNVLSYVLILRSITTIVTILPSPICGQKKVEAIGGCHDCIFSGHTSMTLIFCYYMYLHNPYLKWPLLLYSMIGSFLIIITRSHYTIDVLIAWIVVYAALKTVNLL